MEETLAPIMRLEGLKKDFGGFRALHGIDLDIVEGEFLTVVGPSGSGKTTLIRLLVGMDEATEGRIILKGEDIGHVPSNQRPTCMVFQSLALFPHRTVGQNIEFPLKIRGAAQVEREARGRELLDFVRLPPEHYGKRISQCSGGEQQRVALARALCFDPEILFFDEPLSALDYRLRKTLQKELKELHRRTGKTFVYITHSLEEAMVMSDRIVIMRDGRIAQIGTASEIYRAPQSRFVAEFMGETNLFPVTVEGGSLVSCSQGVRIRAAAGSLGEGERGLAMVRPEAVQLLEDGQSEECEAKGTVMDTFRLGSRIQAAIGLPDGSVATLELLDVGGAAPEPGSPARIGWKASRMHLIREGTGS